MHYMTDSEIEAAASERLWFGASAATDMSQPTCHGCRERPDRDCAACGAPASVWTEAGDDRHAVAWCAACHAELVCGRPANAQPLTYLPSGAPVTAA